MSARPVGPAAALLTACGVLFLTFVDTTIVSAGIRDIQSDLHAGAQALQWTVNAYALVFASLMLTAGSLGDRFGRKRLMVIGIALFVGASVLAALAPTVGALIGARALMGVGAAASEPATLSVLRHVFPQQRTRARAIAAWGAVAGVALAAGPVIGGVLVGLGGWRDVFWFNVAFGALMLAAAWRFLPESADPPPGRTDLAGFVVGTAVLACGVFATIYGETAGYGTGWIIALFALCAVGALVFVRLESRREHPMLNVRYLRDPVVGGSLLVAFAVYFGVFSIFFFTVLYLQEVANYSGWHTAGQFTPMAVAIMVGSWLAGRWVGRAGARTPMVIGCLLAAAGIALTHRYVGVHPPEVMLALVLAVAGLGFGVAVVPVTSAVMGGVPARDSGMAAAATNTARQLGAVVGVAVLGSLVNGHLDSGLRVRLTNMGVPNAFSDIVIAAVQNGSVPQGGASGSLTHSQIVDQVMGAAYAAFHDGLSVALTVSAILLVAAAVVAALGLRRRPA
ncbi:MAG: MFS transporter [Actinomycetia bacterium]|nr:MFS transporter [Actinomycetes bacterium]